MLDCTLLWVLAGAEGWGERGGFELKVEAVEEEEELEEVVESSDEAAGAEGTGMDDGAGDG